MPDAESRSDSSAQSIKAVKVLEWLTFGLGGLVITCFLWVVIARFKFPVDAEWMTGAMREAVVRVRDGRPLYDRPSATFISFLYPPLWYWLSGLLAHVVPTFIACKSISLAATAVCAWGVAHAAHLLGARRFWVITAVLLHFGAYSITLSFYDLERVDIVEAALVVSGLVVLIGKSGRPEARGAIGGVLLGLAFYAKQPGLIVFFVTVAALFWAGERKRATFALIFGIAVLVGVGGWLERSTSGWFSYYCIRLPRSHGVQPTLLTTFFIEDVPKTFMLFGASIAIVAPMIVIALRQRGTPAIWRDVVFAAMLAAGLGGAYFMRTHRGGWTNVIVAWTPLACIAVAVAATRAEQRAEGTRASTTVKLILVGGAAIQLLAGTYDPNDASPNRLVLADYNRLKALVAKLETEGEVVLTMTGDVTHPPHFHSAALYDLLRAKDPAPAEYLEKIRARKYAALIIGSPEEYDCGTQTCIELREDVQRNYFYASRLPERPYSGMTGFDGRPRWLLRPRRTPLTGMSDKELLRRQNAEIGFAVMRQFTAEPDTLALPNDDIEDLAAREAH